MLLICPSVEQQELMLAIHFSFHILKGQNAEEYLERN